MFFKRTDKSLIVDWWLNVDKTLLTLIMVIIGFGVLMIVSASPYAAQRMRNANDMFFIDRYVIYAPVSIVVLFIGSFLSVKRIKFLGILGFFLSLILTFLTLFGDSTKGAARWIDFGFLAIQPSEFLKPCFAIMLAFLLARFHSAEVKNDLLKRRRYMYLTALSFLISAMLLLLQPDIGMTLTMAVIFGAEIFVAGFPMWLTLGLLFGGLLTIPVLYNVFPHIQQRVNAFLNPESADTYQVDMAFNAIKNGGLFGSNSEGRIKELIPDSHTDFVFAVTIEEFGIIAGTVIIVIMLGVILRSLEITKKRNNLFVILVIIGIVSQFAFQVVVNIASTLNLMPTKGMTLPFISYGGSSFLSFAFAFGVLLSFTRFNLKEQG
jgi:cell division protein FtsW